MRSLSAQAEGRTAKACVKIKFDRNRPTGISSEQQEADRADAGFTLHTTVEIRLRVSGRQATDPCLGQRRALAPRSH